MSSQEMSSSEKYTEKLNQWGLLLSVCTYGAHITLFANCIQPLLRPKKTALLAYVITLFSLCTAAIGLQIWWTQVAFIDNHNYNGGPNKYLEDQVGSVSNKAVTLVYLFINWLADGLLLYRFNVLWSIFGKRHILITIFTVSSFLLVIVIGSVYFPEIAGLGLNVWTDMPTSPAIAYLVLSLALNTVLTLLIVYRILSIRSTVREALGKQHGRLYTSLFALIIESASLYTIVAIISVIACGLNSPIQYALLPMLGQLQAIPPLMITYRVAEGRALSHDTCPSLRPVGPLHFSKDIDPYLTTGSDQDDLSISTVKRPMSVPIKHPLNAAINPARLVYSVCIRGHTIPPICRSSRSYSDLKDAEAGLYSEGYLEWNSSRCSEKPSPL